MAWSKEKQRAYMREYYRKNRDRLLAQNEEWRTKNKERHLAGAREYHWKNRETLLPKKREYARKNKDRIAASRRQSYYGITPDQFDAMMRSQGGKCACCQIAAATVVDHDHDTGVVRGLLCNPCNTSLGLLKEDESRIMALLRYASKHKARRATA